MLGNLALHLLAMAAASLLLGLLVVWLLGGRRQ